MAKIKSKKELLYDARNHKLGFLQIEITKWSYDVRNSRYLATVDDFVVTEIETEEGFVFQYGMIATKEVVYQKIAIDGLFLALQNPIELTDSYSDEMDNLLSMALLLETQTNPIYESVAEDWELVTIE